MLPRTLIGAMSPQMSVLQRFGTPALDLNLAGDSTLDPRITATRASTKTYFDSTGTMQTAAINEFPREYDPSTLVCLGRSFWEARTNSIRNNTMVGAAAGTPGTVPTGWSAATFAGITREIIGTGTENGVTYLEVRFSGTATGNCDIQMGAPNDAAALQNQAWTQSVYVKLHAGSLTNISSINLIISEYSAVSAYLTAGTSNITPTSSALSANRNTFTRTLTNASTAFVVSALRINSTGAIDITLRIGMPQLELGATATPVIPTTTAAATRAADVVSMTGTNFSSWYNQTEGTLLSSYAISSDSGASIFPGAFAVSDGTANERIGLYSRSVDDTNRAYVVAGGVTQADLSIGSVVYASRQTAVLAYKVNDIAYSSKGLAVQTDTTATIPTVTQANIGVLYAGTNWLNGWITLIAYWNRRLPNADLQILSRSA